MSKKTTYEIHELAPDQRVLKGQRYQKFVYYAAQTGIWIGYLYFTLRSLSILCSHSRTWQVWTLLLVEGVFFHLSRKEQLRAVAAGNVVHDGPRKRLRLMGKLDLPRVDVLLPCCGEEVDVIMDTVHAACNLDYPISQFRILVLDDGGSSMLEKAVTKMRSQWPQLSYHSRGRQSGQVFAKSGNMNYALSTLQQEFQPEFCAVLDADSIPERQFLRATLPHLLLSPESALVSTRQYFSNLPRGDPLSQTRSHFYTCQNADLDVLGRAIDAGSGAVFRRKAIMDVGMYPTYSFSEDWQLSQILHGMGYCTIQVQEPLQFGLVPTSLSGHAAQRKRWNIGHAQQVPAMLSSGSNRFSGRLRLNIALDGAGIIFGEVGCLFGFAAVPFLLVLGQQIPGTSSALIQFQLLLAFAHVTSMWTYEYLQAATTGFQSAPFAHLENKWLSSESIWGVMRFYLLSSKPKGSFVTGSSANSWNRITTMSFVTKLRRDLWDNGVFYNVVLLLATLGATVYSISTAIFTRRDSLVEYLLTTVAWPPLLHACYLSLKSHWVPVSYLLNPPQYPDRKSQTCRFEKVSNSEAVDEVESRLRQGMKRVGRDMLHLSRKLDIGDDAES
ncbi:nucleotide-diphospho-sugar transferase [Penicillium atrosanguineum]|uniref:Nucleotide-diphospho-sugar transferase n=3 Tax=Penicillium atrosanguineum TaxID=1132637 RepID=A0A9W9KZ02_9EURO|nr:nucleotide-diphospho-sugar transferase [Penicillium atrosanguineum]KAJ5147406.1 nucleotide-diphospho-sugar transferase [Penicillium atrosanguineum]KAJ5331281.1 nucleotide-diphospho-sugar transferase [Penicillium atrosanguineum]